MTYVRRRLAPDIGTREIVIADICIGERFADTYVPSRTPQPAAQVSGPFPP